MRPSAASALEAFRRSSRSGWRTACELVVALVLLASCGSVGSGGAGSGGGQVTPQGAQTVAFTDHGSTQQSRREDPGIVVSADAAHTGLAQLAANAPSGRLFIAVFQGGQSTGGYSVQVDRIEREGDRITVHARFNTPPPGSFNIQVLTSPAQLVSIDRQAAAGAREAVLLDQSSVEIARSPVPQSQP